MPSKLYKCSKCNILIPEALDKCPNCRLTINRLSDQKAPQYDKLGNKAFVLPIDTQKKIKREYYIKRNFKIIPDEKNVISPYKKQEVKSTLPPAALIIIILWFVALFPISMFSVETNNVIIFLLWFLGAGVMIIIASFFMQNTKKPVEDIRIRHTDFGNFGNHNNLIAKTIDEKTVSVKEGYYYSEKTIGFAKRLAFVAVNNQDILMEKFGFFELDKSLIDKVEYDEQNAGYKIWTIIPVREDEDCFVNFWFLPDVFDDTALSTALGRDLPLKRMNF